MNRTIIIYDKLGTVVSAYSADSDMTPPMGIPYIIANIPTGVTVKSVNVTTGQPVYSTQSAVTSEVEKINAKMDYIAMMQNIDISVVSDVMEGNIQEIIDASQENHTKNYYKVYNYFLTDLWTLAAVRNAVGRWITNAEFSQLVIAKDNQNKTIDSSNPIPSTTVNK